MTTQTAVGSTDTLSTYDDECVPGLLSETELDKVAGGGGSAGVNPSRGLSCVQLDQVTVAKGPTGGTLNL
jgi:hypothetical protein